MENDKIGKGSHVMITDNEGASMISEQMGWKQLTDISWYRLKTLRNLRISHAKQKLKNFKTFLWFVSSIFSDVFILFSKWHPSILFVPTMQSLNVSFMGYFSLFSTQDQNEWILMVNGLPAFGRDDQRVTCTTHMNYVLLFRQWSISCLDSFTYLRFGIGFFLILFCQISVALEWQNFPNLGLIHLKVELDLVFLTDKQSIQWGLEL